jgi:hypothetical protein
MTGRRDHQSAGLAGPAARAYLPGALPVSSVDVNPFVPEYLNVWSSLVCWWTTDLNCV